MNVQYSVHSIRLFLNIIAINLDTLFKIYESFCALVSWKLVTSSFFAFKANYFFSCPPDFVIFSSPCFFNLNRYKLVGRGKVWVVGTMKDHVPTKLKPSIVLIEINLPCQHSSFLFSDVSLKLLACLAEPKCLIKSGYL